MERAYDSIGWIYSRLKLVSKNGEKDVIDMKLLYTYAQFFWFMQVYLENRRK